MIGQKRLVERLRGEFERHSPLVLIVGPLGGGKVTVVREASSYSVVQIERGAKVQAVREMIETAYKISTPTVVLVPDADRMSVDAKNSLLKIVEEPPKNVTFVLTAVNNSGILETLRSRAHSYVMEPYTDEQMSEYIRNNFEVDDSTITILKDICYVPGDVNRFFSGVTAVDLSDSVKEFFKFVYSVVDNVAKVSGANAFKISDRVKMKLDDSDKYELDFFWRAFAKVCYDRAEMLYDIEDADPVEMNKYLSVAVYTQGQAQLAQNVSFNRQMLFDSWVIEVRKVWR